MCVYLHTQFLPVYNNILLCCSPFFRYIEVLIINLELFTYEAVALDYGSINTYNKQTS